MGVYIEDDFSVTYFSSIAPPATVAIALAPRTTLLDMKEKRPAMVRGGRFHKIEDIHNSEPLHRDELLTIRWKAFTNS